MKLNLTEKAANRCMDLSPNDEVEYMALADRRDLIAMCEELAGALREAKRYLFLPMADVSVPSLHAQGRITERLRAALAKWEAK